MFSFYGGGYGGYGDDGFDRSTFREKSGAAQRREDAAIAAFDKHAKATEADAAVKAKVTVELLKPSTHLTQPCWTAFNKHVKARAGWTAKRRVATNEEKRASGGTCSAYLRRWWLWSVWKAAKRSRQKTPRLYFVGTMWTKCW